MITFGKFNLADYADCVVVTDKTVSKLYNIEGENVCVLPVGERSKTFATVQKVCDFCLKRGLTRSGKIVTVGGGIVGDVAGFAASVYKRGVNLLHVPTTLLAQVDSANGCQSWQSQKRLWHFLCGGHFDRYRFSAHFAAKANKQRLW